MGVLMKKRMIMFAVLCSFLTGCRIHEYCDYKSVYLGLLGGELGVYVRSKQVNYEKGRKRYARHGFPYELVVGLSVDSYKKFSGRKFALGSLVATGVDTGKTLTLEGGEKSFTKVISANAEELEPSGYSSFRFLITEDMGVTYEPFDIEAEITIIHADGTKQSERIKVRLEKDYKKKRQSDTLDFMESV
jgi:hypothetical protein